MVHAPKLHPEAETLAYGYSDLLMELDQARLRIGQLQRMLDAERQRRINLHNFIRTVIEGGSCIINDPPDYTKQPF